MPNISWHFCSYIIVLSGHFGGVYLIFNSARGRTPQLLPWLRPCYCCGCGAMTQWRQRWRCRYDGWRCLADDSDIDNVSCIVTLCHVTSVSIEYPWRWIRLQTASDQSADWLRTVSEPLATTTTVGWSDPHQLYSVRISLALVTASTFTSNLHAQWCFLKI